MKYEHICQDLVDRISELEIALRNIVSCSNDETAVAIAKHVLKDED